MRGQQQLDNIKHIIVHCAATPNFKRFTARDIERWHAKRGFKRRWHMATRFNSHFKHIGYHFVIELDGRVVTGRAMDEIGAHVRGRNTNSIGVCLIGKDQFTYDQWKSLRGCLINIANRLSGRKFTKAYDAMQYFKQRGITVQGHRDHSPDLNGDGQITRNEWLKICPGFDVAGWVRDSMPIGGEYVA